jgi:hypothetical protein
MTLRTPKSDNTPNSRVSERSMDFSPQSRSPSPQKQSPQKKLTPYQLYMRENYVSLRKQCNDDKKAIFTKCHEMWENESDRVKALYEEKANEDEDETELSIRLEDDGMSTLGAAPRTSQVETSDDDDDEIERNVYMTNRALNLESAVLFATLVAAHHIDVDTRDLSNIDIIRLLDRSMIFPHGLEEI